VTLPSGVPGVAEPTVAVNVTFWLTRDVFDGDDELSVVVVFEVLTVCFGARTPLLLLNLALPLAATASAT